MKMDLLFRARWWLIYGPILAIAALFLLLTYTLWLPPAPRQITFVVGQVYGGYAKLALQYSNKLEAYGIQTDIVYAGKPHQGWDLFQKIIQETDSKSHVAMVSGLQSSLVLSGVSTPTFATGVKSLSNSAAALPVALAAIEREPVWIFSRINSVNPLLDLHQQKIGVPLDDALSLQAVQLFLQQTASLAPSQAMLQSMKHEELVNALQDGRLDTVVMLASVHNEAVKRMLRSEKIHLLGLESVSSILAQAPKLRPFVLPQGVIEFRGNVPAQDLSLLSADLHLMIHPKMHPALQRVLLEVAEELHEIPSFLQRQAEFPSVTQLDFPPSSVAVASIRGDKPLIEKLLPYGTAQQVQWLLFAALPILLLTALVLTWIPAWFDWHSKALLQNFYGELKFLEIEIDSLPARPIESGKLLKQIDAIETRVIELNMPSSQMVRWYTLREHLGQARDKLLDMRSR